MLFPDDARTLLHAFAFHFTYPTYVRFLTLTAAAILTPGRRTAANVVRTLGSLAPGHRTSDPRVLSAARWSGLELGCTRTRFLLDHVVPDGPVERAGDDTVDGHPGKRVYGKARHRDAVRSAHSYTARRYGHQWVVLAVLVTFPFATRRWALPVPGDLYRSPELDRAEGRRHKTPAQLMCRLLRVLLGRFPDRTFVFAGDSGFGGHAVARFGHRHRGRLTVVSKLCPDANRFDPPPAYRGIGRPRVKGDRRPKPREVVAATARRTRLTVSWYGGGTRQVEVVTGTGHWYKSGAGLVPIRWVFVPDREGTHRDEYFDATDLGMTPAAVVAAYGGRWNLETTVQESRSELGLETTRGWCKNTVLRAAPCLFGSYSVVAILYHRLPAEKRAGGIAWPGKATATFSDALAAVRRWLWTEGVFPHAGAASAVRELPDAVRELLLSALTPSA
jgi:hypothetical protein